MGKASRDKGKRGEREVVHLLRFRYPDARRGWQSRQGDDDPDVVAGPWWNEVKRQKQPNIRKAMQQAASDTDGRIPVVWSKADRGEWLVTVRARDLKEILRFLGKENEED